MTMKFPLVSCIFICSSQLTPQYVKMQLEKPFISPVAEKDTQDMVSDNGKDLKFQDRMKWVRQPSDGSG